MGMQKPKGGLKLDAIKGYLPTYEVQDVKLDKEVPEGLKSALDSCSLSLRSPTAAALHQPIVMKGGSLAVFGGSVQVEMNNANPTGKAVDTGLNKLLEKWGVSFVPGTIVADAQCGRARMRRTSAFRSQCPTRPAPVVTFEEKPARDIPCCFRLDQCRCRTSPARAQRQHQETTKSQRTVLRAVDQVLRGAMRGEPIDLKARERWEVPKERESSYSASLTR